MTNELMFTVNPTSFRGKGYSGKIYSNREKKLNLQPLTPVSDLSADNPAIKALHECYMDNRIRNIAITGPYGAGKSSVISSFVKQRNEPAKFINISISSIANSDRNANENFNLEREISKQILNFNPSGKIGQPRNSLRNFSYSELFSQLVWFSVTSIVLILLLMLLRLGPFNTWDAGALEYLLLLLGVVALTFLLGRFLATKNLVAKISAGFAEIDIKKDEVSSFDEYSSQLVTFFQNRPGTTIILEDLDRFDDPTIFDRLHDLNVLLNSATGVDQKNDPIRFIYALKDSIFDDKNLRAEVREKKGNEETVEQLEKTKEAFSESSRRKTKFFDLVIPVLPIVNRSNSFTQICDQLDRRGLKVCFPVIEHVAEFVQDQRLITSIVNEFSVLRDSFVFPSRRRLSHAPTSNANDQAFALTAYKNLFPRDFEKSQFGESTLDKVIDGFNNDKRNILLKQLKAAKTEAPSDSDLVEAFRDFLSSRFEVVKSDTPDFPEGMLLNDEFWLSVSSCRIGRPLIELQGPPKELIVEPEVLRKIPRSRSMGRPIEMRLKGGAEISVSLAEDSGSTWGGYLDERFEYDQSEKWLAALAAMARLVRLELRSVLGGDNKSQIYGGSNSKALMDKAQKRLFAGSKELKAFLEPLIVGGYLVYPVGDLVNPRTATDTSRNESLADSGYGYQKLSRLLRNKEPIRSHTWQDPNVIKELFAISDRGRDSRRQLSASRINLDVLVLLQNMAAAEILKNREYGLEIFKEILANNRREEQFWAFNLVYTCALVPFEGLKVKSRFGRKSLHMLFYDLWQAAEDHEQLEKFLRRVVMNNPSFSRLNPHVNYYIPPEMREWVAETVKKNETKPRGSLSFGFGKLLENFRDQEDVSKEFEMADDFKKQTDDFKGHLRRF